MLKISVPKNKTKERKYIIDVVFKELLGVDIKFEIIFLSFL